MQQFIVTLILVLCGVYTVRRVWRRFRQVDKGDVRCAGCPLADTCNHRDAHPAAAACGCCH